MANESSNLQPRTVDVGHVTSNSSNLLSIAGFDEINVEYGDDPGSIVARIPRRRIPREVVTIPSAKEWKKLAP